MRSQRYSGRWSQNLLTMTWASSPGPARPRAMGAGGRGAVVNVDTAAGFGASAVGRASASAGAGTRGVAMGSFGSGTGSVGAVASGSVTGLSGGAGVAG